MKITLDQVNVVVRDMDAMAAFYEQLGVRLPNDPGWGEHHRSGSSAEGIDLDLDSEAFASVWNEGWPGGSGLVLGFRVESREQVDELYAQLTQAGHTGQQPPYDAFWGSRFAIVTDPDGNAVALASVPDPAHRSTPPTPDF